MGVVLALKQGNVTNQDKIRNLSPSTLPTIPESGVYYTVPRNRKSYVSWNRGTLKTKEVNKMAEEVSPLKEPLWFICEVRWPIIFYVGPAELHDTAVHLCFQMHNTCAQKEQEETGCLFPTSRKAPTLNGYLAWFSQDALSSPVPELSFKAKKPGK